MLCMLDTYGKTAVLNSGEENTYNTHYSSWLKKYVNLCTSAKTWSRWSVENLKATLLSVLER